MLANLTSDLQNAFSIDRLEAYREPATADDLTMLTNYFWNIDLCESLVPCFHALEVALRNSIHSAFHVHYGTDMWFYQPGLLESQQLGQLASALREAAKKTPLLPGKIVAELNFGFWVALLSDRYQRDIWQPNSFALLQQVFPHGSGLNHQRHIIHNRLDSIRILRNRASHHESIFQKTTLAQIHNHAHELISWINPSLHGVLQIFDDFAQTQNGRPAVEAKLKTYLGIP